MGNQYTGGKSLEFKLAMAAYYNDGNNATETARKFGMSRTGAEKIIKKHCEWRPHGYLPESVKISIIEEWNSGKSIAKIAAKLSLDPMRTAKFLRDFGIKTEKRYAGANHGNWRGGRSVDRNGYIKIWIEPNSPYFGWAGPRSDVSEHRLVMAKHLGRPLLKSETVHHIDRDSSNNSIENLQLRQGNHGA
jgi:hypothetical protein